MHQLTTDFFSLSWHTTITQSARTLWASGNRYKMYKNCWTHIRSLSSTAKFCHRTVAIMSCRCSAAESSNRMHRPNLRITCCVGYHLLMVQMSGYECARNANNKSPCCHMNDQRSFRTTLVNAELKKALEQGYEVMECFFVYAWKQTARLFKHMIQQFYIEKMKASGFKSLSSDTPEAREKALAVGGTRYGHHMSGRNDCLGT